LDDRLANLRSGARVSVQILLATEFLSAKPGGWKRALFFGEIDMLSAVTASWLTLFLPGGTAQIRGEAHTLPIAHAGNPIIIPVTIRGKTYPFLLDSGCSSTVVDTSLSRCCEVERRIVSTPAGSKELPFGRLAGASVGGIPLGIESPVVLLDLGRLREAIGVNIQGCLGMDVLSRFVVRIDFDRGELTLLTSLDSATGERLPLKMEGGRPWVQASVSGAAPEWFVIDTGDVGLNSGRLRPDLFNQLKSAGTLKLVGGIQVETVAGRSAVEHGFVDRFSIGTFNHKGLLFSTTSDCNGFSLAFLTRYKATFDFPAGAVYLEPS
jgi:Aspartyl protease